MSDPRSLSRRDLLRYGAGGTATLALAGLLPRAGFPALRRAGSTPTHGGTLRFARSIAPTQLDPANSIIAGDVYTLDKIFEPLFITSPSGQLTPWLATGHAASADQKTHTFSLRPGVKFSDGTPLTAADVAFSINRARSNSKGPLSFLDSAITSVAAKGPSNRSSSRSRRPGRRSSPTSRCSPTRSSRTTSAASPRRQFFANPVGTGPFLLEGFKPDATTLTLKRNPPYWQSGKPYLDAVEFNYVDDDNQRVLQLRGGQVDVIDSVPPADVASLKSRLEPARRALPGVGGRPARAEREAAAVRRPPRAPGDHVRDQPPAPRRGGELRHRQARRLVLPAEPPVLLAQDAALAYSLPGQRPTLAKSKFRTASAPSC